ncbi:DUF389 domain-containing protein [Nocardioides marinquilinus]|uniref:DUF389 domain-containing protein n=1 Tax=Nocardioides marinquilinus TaxID=1210400 RepID=A0ABP9PLG0_9ACTN
MLAHFRLTVPGHLVPDVQRLLTEHDHVTNVTVQPGAVLKPPGDLLEADVARESAGLLMTELHDLGLDRHGGIVISTPTGTPFHAADELERIAPGHPDDAVIWDAVEDAAEAGAVPTLSYHLFLVLAVALAAIAVLTDSAVLVVGAMVVGPEFGAITAVSAGIVLGRAGLVWRSTRLVLFSFAFAVLAVVVLALLGVLLGIVDSDLVTRPRPNTGFIFNPDHWSFVVGVLAGAAGALAVALQRAATMVGVFISVTTVPALGNLALGIAVLDPDEIVGSLAQLGLNVAGMLVAGVGVLLLVRTAWPWLAARTERIFGVTT